MPQIIEQDQTRQKAFYTPDSFCLQNKPKKLTMLGKIRMKSANNRKLGLKNRLEEGNNKKLARYCDDTGQVQSVFETLKQA